MVGNCGTLEVNRQLKNFLHFLEEFEGFSEINSLPAVTDDWQGLELTS